MDASLMLNRRPTGKPVPKNNPTAKVAAIGLASIWASGPYSSNCLLAVEVFFGTGLLVHDAFSFSRLPVALCMLLGCQHQAAASDLTK